MATAMSTSRLDRPSSSNRRRRRRSNNGMLRGGGIWPDCARLGAKGEDVRLRGADVASLSR